MYTGHFGFSERPFDMTPDPKYLYLSHSHKEVFASLIYGIRERRGFISIVGEVGTGKTTLLNAALDQLDEKTKAAYIFNTSITFEEILTTALLELELKKPDENLSKTQAIDRLNNFAIEQLSAGGNVALIIDEAQNLDSRSIENLRLLSNLETRKHKLIQLVIAGQPELDAILRRHELRQLTQRINLKRYVLPLTEKETTDYIQHRLAVADYKGSNLFDRRSQQLIWEYSSGIPRKINILCDNALLTAYGVKKKRITSSLMEEAIKDLTWSPFAPSSAPPDQISTRAFEKHHRESAQPLRRRWSLAAGLALISIIIFGVGLILGNSGLGWRENISRLSQFVFKSQKTSQGGGAGKAPATTLTDEDSQANMTREIESASVPAKDVETGPVPANKIEPAPDLAAKVEVASVPSATDEGETVAELKDETQTLTATKDEAEPVPAVGISTASAPAGKLQDTPVPIAKDEAQSVPVAGTTAAGTPAEAPEDAQVLTEEVVSVSVATTSQTNRTPESVGTAAELETKEEKFPQEKTIQELDVSQSLESTQPRLPIELSIRPGDTLASIIRQHYGSYNKKILSAVLNENPGIQNPDLILAGETLKLPLPSDKP